MNQREIRLPVAETVVDLLLERKFTDVQIGGNILQFAVVVSGADRAVHVMLADDQLYILLAGFTGSLAVGPDDHAVFYNIVAGGKQSSVAFYLNHADAAGADFIDIL